MLRKTRYSAFHGTGLEESLRELGVERVVIAGVMTHLCVESTAREAFIRDFEVVLATDASASASEELHLGSLRALGHGFAFLARTGELLDQLNSGGPMIDLLVIGGGPAGVAGAVQAHRAGLKTLLVERNGSAA